MIIKKTNSTHNSKAIKLKITKTEIIQEFTCIPALLTGMNGNKKIKFLPDRLTPHVGGINGNIIFYFKLV